MAFLDELGEELQEEGDDEQTDVHAIDIGIGGHNHLVVAQGVETILNVEGGLQQVELFVFIHHLLGEAERIKRLAPERKYSLGVDITALGDGTACRIALGDEDGAFFLALVLDIREVDAAVAQLAVVQIGFLGALTGQFGNAGHLLALFLAGLYLLQHHLGHISVLVQIVIHLGLDEIANIFVHAHAVGAHGERTELDFGLALKHGLFHIHGNGSHQSVADIGVFEILVEIFLDGTGDVLLEGTLVGTALSGVLAVDKRMVFFAILTGMGEGYLDVVALEVDDGIDAIVGHGIVEQVFKAVAAQDAPAVVHDGKPRVEISVVAEHGFHEIVVERIILEQGGIGLKMDIGACLVGGVVGGIVLQLATLKTHGAHLAIAIGTGLEMQAQCIDSLDAHAVEPHALLKGL